MLRRTVYAAVIAALLLCAAPGADISGAWEFVVETAQGSGSPSFEFKQDGEKLTGTYSGIFGRAPISGTATRLNSPYPTDASWECGVRGLQCRRKSALQ